MRRDESSTIRDVMEMLARERREERRRSEADVSPAPAAPLDGTDAAPLTDASDTKGG